MNNKGLSLVEVLVAVFVLAIVAGPLLGVFATNAKLVQSSYQRTDGTYESKSLMEGLYAHGYTQLFQQGTANGTRKLDAASGKYYTVSLSPAGAVSNPDTPCYFHLVVGTSGSAVFAGADGALTPSGNLPSLTVADVANLRLKATKAGSAYYLYQGSGSTTLASGTKPAGAMPVLLVLTKSESAPIKVQIDGDGVVIVYSPPALPEASITAPGASSLSIYNNDAPPSKLLITAVLKVYKTASEPQPEHVYQDTLSVGSLP